ncbi:DNA repair protein RecO [Rhodothalassium salexigens]|uniref:DNA repair protein RecO n=1 Tax=Rhodothalassium salexigens TaxID=1086 RepID=UPI001912C874|nr:DNA repair protein RecO [Rhodothalassium salexigens]MBK5911045.1 DNA repair protein RecO [Rhodothalassium salexigens]
MEWQDTGIVLAARRHGEGHAIVDALTPGRGRARGYVRGATSRRLRGVLEPGNEVALTWRARLEQHLGAFQVELVRARAGPLLGDPAKLATLSAACTLLTLTLPEGEAHAGAFEALRAVLDLLAGLEVAPEAMAAALVRLELGLLGDLGYGLDLSRCAATGATSDLVYVSPRTGRAVSREAGRPYHDKLLPLPGFLLDSQAGWVTAETASAGLRLTGFFLERLVLHPADRTLPDARGRLAALLAPAPGAPPETDGRDDAGARTE